MTRFTVVVLATALLMFLTSACKRNQPEEPAAAPVADTTEDPSAQAAAEEPPAEPAQAPGTMPPPADWTEVSATTPKGVTVSFRVPSEWVVVPPPNELTLLVRGARYDAAYAGGTKATLVAAEFEGGRDALVKQTKDRLASFASVENERPMPIGDVDGYEISANWKTPSGNKETVQLIVATGQEAIGVTCELLPGTREALAALCEEIFASVTVKGIKK